MKKILCFGDSNTFGYNPINGLRFPDDARWTGILKRLCSGRFDVIEEGCNNRTLFRHNPDGEFYTGCLILPKFLEEKPDVIVIALGLNDLQRQYRTQLLELKYGLELMIKMIKDILSETEIIILAPAPIGEEVLKAKIFSFLFDKNSIKNSQELPAIYKCVAEKYNCKYIDLSLFAPVSEIDGLHYKKDVHTDIAQKVFSLLDT